MPENTNCETWMEKLSPPSTKKGSIHKQYKKWKKHPSNESETEKFAVQISIVV